MKRFTVTVLSFLLLAVPALAGDVAQGNVVLNANSAFELMKTFAGTWAGESVTVKEEDKDSRVIAKTTVTYKTIANGTSVVATYLEGTPAEMVSVYHQDGPNILIHTHYCAAGNQPVMHFEGSDKAGVIKFLFTKGMNMNVEEDGHVHNSTIRFVDENTISTTSELWNGGKKTSTRYATLKRQ